MVTQQSDPHRYVCARSCNMAWVAIRDQHMCDERVFPVQGNQLVELWCVDELVSFGTGDGRVATDVRRA